MTIYKIYISTKKEPIPFPIGANIGDQAQVFFPTRTITQLVHIYTYNGITWDYTGYTILTINSNN